MCRQIIIMTVRMLQNIFFKRDTMAAFTAKRVLRQYLILKNYRYGKKKLTHTLQNYAKTSRRSLVV